MGAAHLRKGTGDLLPRPWWKRINRMVEEGIFLTPLRWRATVPNEHAFLQAYSTVQEQVQPSASIQACLPLYKSYVALHIRCGDHGSHDSSCTLGKEFASEVL